MNQTQTKQAGKGALKHLHITNRKFRDGLDEIAGFTWSVKVRKASKPRTIIYVDVTEHERGWGSKVIDTQEFKRRDAAERYVNSVNSKNTAPSAPDYYITARIRE